MGSSNESRAVEVLRRVTGRALSRLNLLEYVLLFAAAVLALAGGALVAWMVSWASGVSFRLTWGLASLLLFLVPGAVVYLRELKGRSVRVEEPGREGGGPGSSRGAEGRTRGKGGGRRSGGDDTTGSPTSPL